MASPTEKDDSKMKFASIAKDDDDEDYERKSAETKVRSPYPGKNHQVLGQYLGHHIREYCDPLGAVR